jgi:hypothetical protein
LLTTPEAIILILACPGCALLVLWTLDRFWPSSQRHVHNDIIGWQVTILSTIYAVMMGFMLFAVWERYLTADVNAEAEANCLVSVFRLADGLPPEQRDQVHRLARQYADIVIEQEWPTMHTGGLSSSGNKTIQRLWEVVLATKADTMAEQASVSQALAEISTMTEHRRVRQHDSQTKLPGVLWMVLILGGVITMFSACLFGVDSFPLHCIQAMSLALLIALILVAIAEIDHPFQGTVHLSPNGFERARATFAEVP